MRPWATMIKSSFASVLLLLVLGAAPLSASVIVSGWDFQNVPAVTLDPTGASKFKTPVLIAPQGDIGMGAYTSGTSP